MSVLDYLAGFFDGEGSVGIYGKSDGESHKASLVVQVVQNDSTEARALLEEYVGRFGGSISEIPPPDRVKLNWSCSGEKACVFLETLLPHLRLKRDQAVVGVEWYRNRPPLARDARGRIVRRPPEQVVADRVAMARIKRLKNLRPATTH